MLATMLATAGAAASPAGVLGNPIVPLIMMVGIFYFLMIRPQQQASKKHKEMLSAVRRGDKVVTSGGLVGKIVKVPEGGDEVIVEVAEGVQVTVVRATLSDVRSKTRPAEKQTEKKSDKKDAK